MVLTVGHVRALLENIFKTFNADVTRQFNSVGIHDYFFEKYLPGHDTQITRFLLNTSDCAFLAQEIVRYHHLPNPLAILKPPLSLKKRNTKRRPQAASPLHNSALIYATPSSNIRILIRPRLSAQDMDEVPLMGIGSSKATKSFGCLIEIDENGLLIFARPELIWARLPWLSAFWFMPRPAPFLSRAEKTEQLKTAKHHGFEALEYNEANINDPFDSLLYHQAYKGMDLHFVLQKNPACLQETATKMNLLSQFLSAVFHVLDVERFWPSDLKLENICIWFRENGQFQLSLIDYDFSQGGTYSFFKRDPTRCGSCYSCLIGNRRRCLKPLWSANRLLVNALGKVRNPHLSDSPDFPFILRTQLMFEMLHVCYLITAWPRLNDIQEAGQCQKIPFTLLGFLKCTVYTRLQNNAIGTVTEFLSSSENRTVLYDLLINFLKHHYDIFFQRSSASVWNFEYFMTEILKLFSSLSPNLVTGIAKRFEESVQRLLQPVPQIQVTAL